MYKYLLGLFCCSIFTLQAAQDYEVVQLYTQDELVVLINKNQHLARVKKDECQLVQDIEAHATKVQEPSYQFLWGDMLAWGVCVDKDPELGVYFMWQAANQGLPAALEQLGRYYVKGTLVQRDIAKAMPLLRESAGLGFLPAQLQWADLLVKGNGSPKDYEEAYRLLHHAIIGDKKTYQQAAKILKQLSQKMPANIVARAKRIAP
ncbi:MULTISPECIES: flagellar protein MotX [unclassified Motilimonas]|uniref:tetratricopeptide repeat protein n=1 Tax=Motilimonas TaxID=1914248 RepID=UPI001E48B8B0|nr:MULTISPECIES: flagellar protein MotX [unclassified Motilimonas]MCE0557139.1 flagellar protein MotX [Motilimonas sp. E26]MDO6524374.1 flagellar protein MotX [Motilimonas sp. 1_MG-2023]